ncbi:MAG: VCBS repeat-containing protein, partial [Gammaproteobacteria bacterium]|nr:VCBS repeat-containing protein [Gammaproteobacteria bacterium]
SDSSGTFALIGNQNGYSVETFELPPSNAVAWGDLNNDGSTELIACSDRGISITAAVHAADRSAQSISNSECQFVRTIDADHDGDLDVLVGSQTGFQIYHNDMNGSFDLYAVDEGPSFGTAVTQVLAEDLDRDRDVDLVLVGNGGMNQVLRNELTWRYEPFAGLQELENTTLRAITALDVDVDGRVELITASTEGNLDIWEFGNPNWSRRSLEIAGGAVFALDAHDFDGDGRSDLFVAHRDGFTVFDPRSSSTLAEVQLMDLKVALPVYVNAKSGPAVVTASSSGVEVFPAGNGRYSFLAINPSGRTSADQMRSNASGIGTYIKLRADTRWSVASSFSYHSGASQSLMPIMFGSGGADRADYAELLWSDGVTQSEIALDFGELHVIEEIQRQLASCPVVFVWNGEKYEFVSDVLGVAALGYFAEPGVTTPVRSKERILLPDGLLQPRAGRYEVKIGEPMEEILYLDSASLIYFDAPHGWSMTLDERLNVKSASPTSKPIYFEKTYDPVRAATNIEPNVLGQITKTDYSAVDPGPVDPRFIGLLANELTLTLEFDTELPEQNAVLVADGWVEFPYSQTSFAAYQSNAKYQAPTIEARDRTGSWFVVAEEFGFPAGMPKQMALPLPPLPKGTTALRLRSNLEIYWDRIRIVKSSDLPNATSTRIQLDRAIVRTTGFAHRTTGSQRTPYYDYDSRHTSGDAKLANGFYTVTGDATELVLEADSAVAIVGSGEEVHLEFAIPNPPKEGYQRYYALEFQGWAKDMDLYTENGDTVDPLPIRDDITAEQLNNRNLLHAR